MTAAVVTFTAACPACGLDCTWHQTVTSNYPSYGPVEQDQQTEIRCECPLEQNEEAA